MEEKAVQNKIAVESVNKLFWKLGLPMIVSMVLQALYNVVDSVFVTNMQGTGALANEALTIAFPVQIMIIAIGVGTGVGLNAMLSKNLGKNDKETVNAVAGNGIFLSVAIYAVFLLFGLFLSKRFIGLFTANEQVFEMGVEYMRICTCFSLGSIGYTVYERFLQATGKTALSTIAQIFCFADGISVHSFARRIKHRVVDVPHSGNTYLYFFGNFFAVCYKKYPDANSDIQTPPAETSAGGALILVARNFNFDFSGNVGQEFYFHGIYARRLYSVF